MPGFKFPEDNFILLETNRFDSDNYRSFLFLKPSAIISCHRLQDVKRSFLELQEYISRGYYAAGFISYEAGFSFEEGLRSLGTDSDFPLMWFGIYKKPLIFTHRKKRNFLKQKDSPYRIENLHPNISRKEYIENIKKIKGYIRQGNTYQVNYTFKYRFGFSGSIYTLYKDLKEKQSVSYSSLIKTGRFCILSFSPELFFRKNNRRIEVRPMKGTIHRGKGTEEDVGNMRLLEESIKNRSENVMIVDLLRNDLGRISKTGTVRTEKLFSVERYETLLQMISIVKSVLKKDVDLYGLFKAIFPSGSVTGAPKISTMRIINSLEKEGRGIYTGGIGFFAPDGEAVFNVAIRTLLINNAKGTGEMGIGSGIVYDSDPDREFEECKLKARFMIEKKKDFQLIETMLWRPEKGYFLIKGHLERLSASCGYFNFKFDRKYISGQLKNLERQFRNGCDYRVRLLLDRDGKVGLSFAGINKDTGLAKVRFSSKKISSGDVFLYHKTTNRGLYDEEHKKWRDRGYFDIIFTNEKNHVTEGAISNIIIKKGRFYYTPPLDCGLLKGVFRNYLFKSKDIPVKERVLYKKDIRTADEIYMVNSVRGMVRVTLR